jgi:hypothetical protein
MYTGLNLTNDDLVFGYDTGYGVADYKTTTRFFKGAPTINYIHSQNAVAQDSYTTYSATSSGTWNAKHPNAIRAYNALGGDITSYINSGVTDWTNTYHAVWELDPILKKPVVVMNDVSGQWKAKSFGTGLGSWTSQGKTHGSTYTISWLQWVDNLSKNAKTGLYTKNSSGGNGFHDGQANSASSYNTKLRTWQRVYQTYTTNNVRDLSHAQASLYMYGHYDVRATVKIADVQFTWGSTPFPFSAEYERLSTKSLIDLKRSTDINVGATSFDSTGQPTFDGTDDTITFNPGTFPTSWQQPFSVEAVVYIPSGATWYNQGSGTGIIGRGSYTGSWGLYRGGTDNSVYFYMRTGSNTYNPGGTIGRDKFYHIVGTWDGTSQAIFYINGSQNSQETSTSVGTTIDNTGDIKIGGNVAFGGSNGGYGEGTFPVVKLYSKKLTATEIQQNYKAYKNRFNI